MKMIDTGYEMDPYGCMPVEDSGDSKKKKKKYYPQLDLTNVDLGDDAKVGKEIVLVVKAKVKSISKRDRDKEVREDTCIEVTGVAMHPDQDVTKSKSERLDKMIDNAYNKK
jgi:hypothetical protein